MERALTRADEVLLESRSRVKDLRDSLELRDDLPATLESVGQQLSQESPAAFGVVVEGNARKLHPIVQEEVFMIGREALANAFHHANAQRIEVDIEFRSTELRLRVRDDGRGLEREVLDAGGRSGHFGLGGMRERAERFGRTSTLPVVSGPVLSLSCEYRRPWLIAEGGEFFSQPPGD